MAPKISLKDLYGERGAARFTKQRNPANVRAQKAYPNGTTRPGQPSAGAPPSAQPWRRVPGQPIPGGTPAYPAEGFGRFNGVDRTLLDAKLSELDYAFKKTLVQYIGGSGLFPGDQVIQDMLGGSAIAGALKQTYRTLQLLGGDLYQAVIGQHVFPLDAGEGINEAGALVAWNQLAGSAQETLNGVLGYMGKWGPLPGLWEGGKQLVNPLNWPWYLKLAAGAAAVYYGSKFLAPILGVAGAGRRAAGYSAFRTLPGYHKKRRKR